MHIYDESTARRAVWRVRINWSKERTFSRRQINYIKKNIPHARGVYCVYDKCHIFDYHSPDWTVKRWSRIIYIGSGWLDNRLCAHLAYQKNDLLAGYVAEHRLAYRYDRIIESDITDWPKTVEASLLRLFHNKFNALPRANRRKEAIPDLSLDGFIVNQSDNFDFLARG